MARKCRRCGEDIPDERWASSWYCSEYCAYEQKKERSNARYYKMKQIPDKINEAEATLAALHSASIFGLQITMQMLINSKFDFGLSTGEKVDKEKRIWKIVGAYAYYLEPKTLNVYIWSLK